MINRSAGLRDWAALILRLALGVTFILHGYPKLFPDGPAGFAGFVRSLGFPAPLVLAWIVSLLEVGGGAAMILGVLVRYVGALFVIEMLVTALYVKMSRGVAFIAQGGTGWELDILLGTIALAIVLIGPGAYSLDAAARSRRGSSFR